jgi:hypothetical protein
VPVLEAGVVHLCVSDVLISAGLEKTGRCAAVLGPLSWR